jgi:ABC-2 type transport system ATP-binding protein
VVEIELFGIPPEVVEKVRGLDIVDNVAVESRDQRQVMMIHTSNGPEAIPVLVPQLEGLKVGRIISREPTLEDAYVRLVGGAE